MKVVDSGDDTVNVRLRTSPATTGAPRTAGKVLPKTAKTAIVWKGNFMMMFGRKRANGCTRRDMSQVYIRRGTGGGETRGAAEQNLHDQAALVIMSLV